MKSFNPSQVQFTLRRRRCVNTHICGFNPSQVQFTPSFISFISPLSNLCFNPSQVQFTPFFLLYNKEIKYKFQSLTGSIHTKIILPR